MISEKEKTDLICKYKNDMIIDLYLLVVQSMRLLRRNTWDVQRNLYLRLDPTH